MAPSIHQHRPECRSLSWILSRPSYPFSYQVWGISLSKHPSYLSIAPCFLRSGHLLSPDQLHQLLTFLSLPFLPSSLHYPPCRQSELQKLGPPIPWIATCHTLLTALRKSSTFLPGSWAWCLASAVLFISLLLFPLSSCHTELLVVSYTIRVLWVGTWLFILALPLFSPLSQFIGAFFQLLTRSAGIF